MGLSEAPDSSNACPGRDALAAYSAGKLTPADINSIASHVASCGYCEETLAGLQDHHDTLVRALQQNLAGDSSIDAADLNAVNGGMPQVLRSGIEPPRFAHYDLLAKLGEGG